MIAFEQDDLPRDPSVLRHITENADLLFGVYARVIRPAMVRVEDAVPLGHPMLHAPEGPANAGQASPGVIPGVALAHGFPTEQGMR